MKRRKVLLLYPYYWPHYKAGGPVQSLYNLAALFKNKVAFYFISLDKDIDGRPSAHPLKLNGWSLGPNDESIFCTSFISPLAIVKLIREVKPDIILINGIFHWHTSFFGLLIGKVLGSRVIISPRGMLQEWALKRGKLKKLLFLKALKLLVSKNEDWHATDEQEEKDIYKIFGLGQRVHIASNIPRPLGELTSVPFPDQFGKIRIVFLSLINPNKNLHLVIDAVNEGEGKFTLDIYGPVIDSNYWQLCQHKLNHSPWISYKGAVPPWEVSKILQGYHFFVLPTQGENFGHAIFDALSSGVPVVISRFTPWKDIDSLDAGLYIDLNKKDSIDNVFKFISELTPSAYALYRSSAHKFAQGYLESKDFAKDYNFLLSKG